MPAAAPAPAAPACAPIDKTKVAPFVCDAKVVKKDVPPIVDPKASIAHFYDRIAELARGRSKKSVRIAVYGDSNMLNDALSGHLRRTLQGRFGDAGHGYVALARPWGGYKHEDVVHGGHWQYFKMFAPTTHLVVDRQYGFANVAAETSFPGATVWAGTTKDKKSVVGQNVSRFELYFLKQPRGGSFKIQIDGQDIKTVETRADEFDAGIEIASAPEDGAHEMKAIVRGDGPVRFFGTSLDREGVGIQVDGLGVGALDYKRLTWVANGTRRVQLAKRDYDLVILWIGTNIMWIPPAKEHAKEFIAELRASMPGVPVLVLTPPDTVKAEAVTSDPRIVQVANMTREVAQETDSAWWDFREAMGGDGSMVGFEKRGLAGPDRIHLGREGSELMASRLLCALFDDLGAHVEKNPEAGCR